MPWRSPYSLPPWQPEDHPSEFPVLRILRGDFFCFPFGVTEGLPYPHGETANCPWRIEAAELHSAQLRMELTSMPGTVVKRLRFDPQANALWQEHQITGVTGQYNYGHHPTLQVPAGTSANFSASPWDFGQVHPEGEGGFLRAGARFSSLADVPLQSGGRISLESYPHAPRSEDFVMLSAAAGEFAWNALSLRDFLWISLRRTADFPSTLLWMSNGGRINAPWNSVHAGRIGIEDVCSYFHDGAHRSRLDLLARERIATSREFRANQCVTLQHLQIAIPLEKPFGPVADVWLDHVQQTLTVTDPAGRSLQWPCPFTLAPSTQFFTCST